MRLGDAISQALAVVGVTEDRVRAWVGGECRCRERRERLNSLTFWARRVLSGKVERAAEYLDAITGSDEP